MWQLAVPISSSILEAASLRRSDKRSPTFSLRIMPMGPAPQHELCRLYREGKAGLIQRFNASIIAADPQDLASWSRDGVAGLQSVVLYSLPELDGAIDTVPLGGLVGDNIYLAEERVHRLAGRLKKWVNLRRTQPKVLKL